MVTSRPSTRIVPLSAGPRRRSRAPRRSAPRRRGRRARRSRPAARRTRCRGRAGLRVRPLTSSATSPIRARSLCDVVLERPADHQPDDVGIVDTGHRRRCVATLRPSRKIVTRSQSARTSSSRCEMKMMVRPSSRSLRAMPNSVSTSFGVSGAVGSSMMMSRRRWRARGRSRPSAGRRWTGRASDAVNVDAHAQKLHQRARLAPSSRPSGRAPSGASSSRPSTRFSATDRSGNEIGSWWISVMPRCCAAMGEATSTGRPFERERAARRAVHAGEDLGEGRLARAVLAQKRVDLALVQVEVDVGQYLDTRELLRDAARRDEDALGHGAVRHGVTSRRREPARRGSMRFSDFRSVQKAAGIGAWQGSRRSARPPRAAPRPG